MKTSWESSHAWYDSIVGTQGHYYHEHLIIPNTLRLLGFRAHGDRLIDLGCGQGVLERAIPSTVTYVGVDASPSLLAIARKHARRTFYQADITQPLTLKEHPFSHAVLMLVLQNLEQPEQALLNAARLLQEGGQLLVIINHPCFRIPRQSSWGVDASKQLQYRRVDRYMTPMEIPIQTHPGGSHSPTTFSFHRPLGSYVQGLHQAGFVIETLEEWISDKTSTGSTARMENRCRKEFPLFLALSCRKYRTLDIH